MRYLILADVHANATALATVLERESDWDAVLFLGDAVDDGPRPDAVLSMLASESGTFLMGNHDRAIIETPPEAPPPDSRDFARWTSARLSSENRDFLASFSDSTRIETTDGPLRLHHGDFELDVPDWNGRLWPDTDRAVYEALADRYDEPTVVSAHSHVQFERHVNGTHFINPGSVGQHRLGVVEACYAVLADGEFQFKTCEYDAERTVAAMERVSLDDDYLAARKRVYTEGVLPVEMRDFAPLREQGYQ